MRRPLPQGIYTPLPCFFCEGSEDLDLETYKRHVTYTATAGTIPVVSGTAGEAPHLSNDERRELIKAAREALDEADLHDVPVIAGIGAPSTRESIVLAREAAGAGADFVIAIAPGYYASTLASNEDALKMFFIDIATASPVPVMMYNFPAVSGGIDLSSDIIIKIAKEAPNICGVKLTCANVGKLTRVTAVVNDAAFIQNYPRKDSTAPFLVIDGLIDFLLPSMTSNSSGAITGLANFAPRTCVMLWKCCLDMANPSSLSQAKALQNMVSSADGVILGIGIPGMKYLLCQLFGYTKYPRKPLLAFPEEKGMWAINNDAVRRLIDFETALARDT